MRPTDVLAFVKFNLGIVCVAQSLAHHEQSYMIRRFLFISLRYLNYLHGRKQRKRNTRARNGTRTHMSDLINRAVRKSLESTVIATVVDR